MLWSTLTGRLEGARRLDPAVEAVAGATSAVLRKGRAKDLLHGTWLGHPVHPMLVALPIGLWTGASLLDLTGGDARAARRLVGTGLLAVVPTAATGLADWSELGEAKRPKRVGLVHAAANTVTAALYAASWLARRRGEDGRGRDLALAGAGTLMVGGYLGGHLAFAQAVGVNRNADETRAPRDWTDVAAVADVPEGALHRVEVKGRPVVLARRGGELFALSATCSHWGAPLDEGEVRDGCLVCPWHGSAFRLRDGAVVHGPATVPQTAYEVRAAGDRLELRVRR